MNKRSLIIIAIAVISYVGSSCSRERLSNAAPDRFRGNLRISIVDSFHFGDSTASLAAAVGYSISHESGYYNKGIAIIDSTSPLGNSFNIELDSIPAGTYSAVFSANRPFVILGRKDDTGDARFIEIRTTAVPIDSTSVIPPIEIWAYRLNRLVVYFKPNVSYLQADTIIERSGAEVIMRSRSILSGAPFYLISTERTGTEVELRAIIERMSGVEATYFDIWGHSYF